jgi:hypothetical protein
MKILKIHSSASFFDASCLVFVRMISAAFLSAFSSSGSTSPSAGDQKAFLILSTTSATRFSCAFCTQLRDIRLL